jgi:hypothetical protein
MSVLGLALISITFLWWGGVISGVTILAVLMADIVALALLYETGRPLRSKSVPVFFGIVALTVLNIGGSVAVRDATMTLLGVDGEAVVESAWTTKNRGVVNYHCTLRRVDGTRIPRELASDCMGHQPGDVIPVVVDPRGRFPPVEGPKSSLSVMPEAWLAGIGGLVLLITVAIGSPSRKQEPASAGSVRKAARPSCW